ncbi:XRN-Two binding domain, XTBD domain-containing protein [Ditylenchus destructor]|uniref:XRN-Two binding domain, XTBD domain-containing protein n=1 Tax=Ditylenchus destructor TaxID=166010 RepID=A0AAD4N7X8_9BILA|nr:XRN-Two binding domain, XTBD domain-containing protein [Ditylenchus destructor]
MSWIEEERGSNESGTQWKLRRAFLMRYENDYPKSRLKCLSMMFSNVIFLSCKYSGTTMKQIDQFAKDLEAEVQEAKQTKILREAFSLPTLDSDEEEEDEGQVDDYTKLSREMSRMKIPDPETIPSPLPRPGFTTTKRDFASPPTKRDIAPAPISVIPMSLIKMKDHKATAVVRADMSRRQTQKKKPNNIDEGGEKQFVKKVTIVTASKSKNGKGDRKTPDNEKSDEKLEDKASLTEFTKKKKNKNKKKKSKPANEECQDEELVGAVISQSAEKQGEHCQEEDLVGAVISQSAEKQGEHCQDEELVGAVISQSAEKQGEHCQEEDLVGAVISQSAEKQGEHCQDEELVGAVISQSAEKQGENFQEEEPDEATTTIVKETDE